MSTNVNLNVLKDFITDKLGGDKLTKHQAQKLDIDYNDFIKGDIDENSFLDLDEIIDSKDLYSKFATLYTEETNKKAEAKDKEKEKEEQSKVPDGPGGAKA